MKEYNINNTDFLQAGKKTKLKVYRKKCIVEILMGCESIRVVIKLGYLSEK